MKWLTDGLKKRIRNRYEPQYNRPLTDTEVTQIAINLTQLVEHFLQYKRRINYGTK
jgi:hypothetical protein